MLIALGAVLRPLLLAELPRLNIDAGVVFIAHGDPTNTTVM